MRLEFPNERVIVLKGDNVVPKDELPGIPPDIDIDFGIDVLPCTQPISIPPYRTIEGFVREWFHLTEEGIKFDPQKIAAMTNWPRTTTPTDICIFLGLAGYYRKFVEGFSTLASPLTKLTQKSIKLQWYDACERSFQELKSRLTIAPVLTLLEAALRWKSMGSLAHFESYQWPLSREVHQLASLGVCLEDSNDGKVIVQNKDESSLVAEVKEKQYNDPLLVQLKDGIHKHKATTFSLGMDDGTLRYQGRLCVLDIDGLFERIMGEAHISRDLDFKEDDWLELPLEMSLVHPVFHVSMLKKVVGDPSAIVPIETIEVNEVLSNEETPAAILDMQVLKLRNKEIAFVKVL
uniref:Uncharacterized protein LOC104250014 n=1 Tax=Nicotiana sylvestris TaxID=4096 RepID=A0A1U7Z1S8_NICSY|nr:PREDICTED: uncharacterized protein LOC104250014 [Nicotiana sylvestris]